MWNIRDIGTDMVNGHEILVYLNTGELVGMTYWHTSMTFLHVSMTYWHDYMELGTIEEFCMKCIHLMQMVS